MVVVCGLLAFGGTALVAQYTAAHQSIVAAEDAAPRPKPLSSDALTGAADTDRNDGPLGTPRPPSKQRASWLRVVTDLAKDRGLCGIVVDHKTGCVWINVIGRGVFCSPAGAQKFQPVVGYHLAGYNETPGCWLLDPTGATKKAVTALVHGCQCSV